MDPRPAVLYLRSFRNDKLPAAPPEKSGLPALFDPYREILTFEEMIVRRCIALGPVVAISDPKTFLPSIGAARERAGAHDWREVVQRLMAEASWIVVLMDYTENLEWELVNLSRLGHNAKTVLIFPPGKEGTAHDGQVAMVDLLRHIDMAQVLDALTLVEPSRFICGVRWRARRCKWSSRKIRRRPITRSLYSCCSTARMRRQQ